MAEFPALPIFTDAFIADTLHLNAAQTGAYFMLLMVAWRTKDCALPNDDTRLASFARMDKRSWMSNREVLLAFWHVGDDGMLRQKRLTDERKHAEDRRNQAVQAGRASALKRNNRHSTDVPTERQPKVNNPLTNPNPLTKEVNKPPLIPPKRGTSATRLSDDWQLGEDGWEFAQRAGVVNIRAEAEKFKDHFLAAPGMKGRKENWNATWRNWVRRSLEPQNRKQSQKEKIANDAQQLIASFYVDGAGQRTPDENPLRYLGSPESLRSRD